MKAKVKVASIILALVAITIAGYFAGCSDQRAEKSVTPTESPQTNMEALQGKEKFRAQTESTREGHERADILLKTDESGISLTDEEVLGESKVIFNDGHIDYERFGRDVDGDQFSLYERETVYSVKGG